MKKQLVIAAVLLMFGFGLAASAHDSGRSLPDIFKALGVAEPTLLPDSTFYFIKDWGRGIQMFFTFDSAKKAALEGRFADERMAEIEKLAAEKPNEKDALSDAFKNYLDARAKLTERLDALKGKNKNTDALLEKIAEQTLEHQKLFDDLQGVADENDLEQATDEIASTTQKALELDEKTFKEKLKEKIRRDEDGADDKDALDKINEQDDNLNESLGDIQDELETEDASLQKPEDINTEDLENIKNEFNQEKPRSAKPEDRRNEAKPAATENQKSPEEQEFKIQADDSGFYPASTITVSRGTKVKIEFLVKTTNVYYGGLRFVSPVFTVSAKPGEKVDAEFTADQSFTVTSYWPLTDVKKANLQIQVQ